MYFCGTTQLVCLEQWGTLQGWYPEVGKKLLPGRPRQCQPLSKTDPKLNKLAKKPSELHFVLRDIRYHWSLLSVLLFSEFSCFATSVQRHPCWLYFSHILGLLFHGSGMFPGLQLFPYTVRFTMICVLWQQQSCSRGFSFFVYVGPAWCLSPFPRLGFSCVAYAFSPHGKAGRGAELLPHSFKSLLGTTVSQCTPLGLFPSPLPSEERSS